MGYNWQTKKMKNFAICFLALFTILGTFRVRAQVSTATVVGIISASVAVYNAIPTADYTVEFAGVDGEQKYTKANSCDEALYQAYSALKAGAEYAYVRTKYPTVNRSCADKKYYKEDIELLEEKLGYR